MDLMERFLDGEISVMCHSRDEIKKFSTLFEPDSMNYRVAMGALRNSVCISGAEFAYEGRHVRGERYLHYNPIGSPLYRYARCVYTETVDFSEFWDGLNSTLKAPDFDPETFYAMLGIGGGV